MKWKLPPRIKVYEALGAVADGRVTEVTAIGARVKSSEGNKTYTVICDEMMGIIGANDNGSYWQGYMGYPAIAFLMVKERLPFNEELAESLKGVAWKQINTKYKNDFTKTEAEIYQKVNKIEIEAFAENVLREIGKIEWQKPVDKMRPPTN